MKSKKQETKTLNSTPYGRKIDHMHGCEHGNRAFKLTKEFKQAMYSI